MTLPLAAVAFVVVDDGTKLDDTFVSAILLLLPLSRRKLARIAPNTTGDDDARLARSGLDDIPPRLLVLDLPEVAVVEVIVDSLLLLLLLLLGTKGGVWEDNDVDD